MQREMRQEDADESRSIAYNRVDRLVLIMATMWVNYNAKFLN